MLTDQVFAQRNARQVPSPAGFGKSAYTLIQCRGNFAYNYKYQHCSSVIEENTKEMYHVNNCRLFVLNLENSNNRI